MSALSNWREEFNLSEVVTGKMTDKEALKKVSERSNINNKVTINPKLDEAVKEIGGEVISMTEADTTSQKQRLDMKQMILDRQKLKLRRKDMTQAKQEKKQGVEGESTGALKQGNVIAQEEKFTPHKMIDKKSGKEYWADTEDKHLKYKKMGYVHEAADVKLETEKNCGCGQNPCITYGKKKLSQSQKVDEGVMKFVKDRIGKKKPMKKPEKAMDAGAIARRKLQQKDHETVNFLPMDEAKVDQGRSDYGKASIRNYRRKGPGHGEPAMFDPENKRGKLIDKRREEHKARRGVKGAKVPAYKVDEAVKGQDREMRKMAAQDRASGKDRRLSPKEGRRSVKPVRYRYNEEDKAFNFVLDKIRKEVGKDGYVSKDNPRKPQSAADKEKARAHQAKVDKENAAARAKDPSQGRYPKG